MSIDINFYKKAYSDVFNLTDDEIKIHYEKIGKKQRRLISFREFFIKFKNIDEIYKFRKNNNNYKASDYEIMARLFHNNYDEIVKVNKTNILNEKLNIIFYKNAYTDINNKSDEEIYNHYLEIGKKENRLSHPVEFFKNYTQKDIENYKNKNKNIKLKEFEIIARLWHSDNIYEKITNGMTNIIDINKCYYNDNLLSYLESININIIDNFKLLNKKILIIIPSLSIGGGNYWAEIITKNLKYFGFEVIICFMCKFDNSKKFYFKNLPDIKIIYYNQEMDFDLFTDIIITVDINIINLKKLPNTKIYGFTHSDISFINNNLLNNYNDVICLNNITKQKFLERGYKKNISILNNYLDNTNNINNKIFDINNIKILYCNRISLDKNILMVLYAIKKLISKYKIHLTLLAGGYEQSFREISNIKLILNKLKLDEYITLLPTQKDIESYYINHDFCFLLSVNEGSSYSIKEAINYEIPIITTNIDANNEITKNLLPTVNFKNHKEFSNKQFCVTHYEDFLLNLGYTNIKNTCVKCSKKLLEKNINIHNIPQSPIYSPTLLYENYEDEDLCINCRSKICDKINTFEENVTSIYNGFINIIENYDTYKKNISILKKDISDKYFSEINYKKKILEILFNNYQDF